MNITINTADKDLLGHLAGVGSTKNIDDTLHVVVFSRNDGEDADTGYWPGGPDNDAGAIEQFCKELQEAYDQGHLAGHFAHVGRLYRGQFTTAVQAKENAKDLGKVRIIVRQEDGTDITSKFIGHAAIDGGRRSIMGAGLPSLDNLTSDEARTVLSQLIDEGHEWGNDSDTDRIVECLRDLIDPTVSKGGFITVPDGWTIKVIVQEDED